MTRINACILMLLFAVTLQAQQIAFPGAEGFGKFATGGRTGSVYRVTNLNDSGTGSLRDAVSQPNRIVVFDVAGVIKLNSTLIFKANQYIAGQTAPGEGITVYGNRVSFSGANNTICRYMKFRMGEKFGDSGKDACGIANGTNMIFDHCSVSWGRDETFSISWDGKGVEPANITIQNCIISQGLMSHSAGGLIQTNGGVTLYRNLYIDNDTRNNKIKGVNQYVNNIVYNWKSAAYIMGGDSEGQSFANCVGNYFIKGPENGSAPLSGANANFHIYAEDNWFDNNLNGTLDGYLVPKSEYSGGPDFKTAPFNYPILPKVAATALYTDLIPSVGASLPCRDYVDYFVVNELNSLGIDGRIITSEDELPFGSPDKWSLWTGTKRTDTDGDGMPDEWEQAYGLNSNLASDAMAIATNGYANIENYINSIDGKSTQAYLRKPLNFRLSDASQNSVTLQWFDYTEAEDGYIIERQVDGVFKEIGRTTKNAATFTVEGLQPEEVGTYRVKAYNATLESAYSNELTVKAKPVPVNILDLKTFVPDLTWTGSVNQNWDKESANWLEGKFSDGKKVLFGNGITNQTISLAEKVSPEAVVVSSDSSYVFSGSGEISGTASVNKTGNGTLALPANNTYTGATVIHDGTLEINKLANGGLPSSIGASQNYDFNWVWLGGKIDYTGGTTTTDRNVVLDANTEFSVRNSATVVTLNGSIAGQGGLIKSGPGSLIVTKINPYAGVTTISGGTLEVNGLTALEGNALGTSGKVVLNGGKLKLWGGNSADYETYTFAIEVAAGKASSLEVDRTSYLKNKVSGQGDLHFNIIYVREYLQGDWSQFSGTLYANGIGATSDGNQLLLNNTNGIPNGRVVTSGNTKIVCWKNASTMRLGGLSGPSGTYLAGADKQNNGATMTWIVGGAGTDETFSGIINNECSNKSYKGTTSIVKEGTGKWRLNGGNIYSGTTRVTDGELIINGYQSGTGTVTVEGGKLSGKGRVGGQVVVREDAILSPGDSSINTFTCVGLSLNAGSITEMDIDKNALMYDRVSSTGTNVYNGTLKLTITGNLIAGDKFTLFTGSSHSGNFAAFEPEKPGAGLRWEFDKGVLSVVSENAVKRMPSGYLNIYPNPFIDKLKLNLSFVNGNLALVQLLNINGTIIFSDKLNLKSTTEHCIVGLCQLPKGIYFCEITTDSERYMQKLVK